jgi:hypothetical protein
VDAHWLWFGRPWWGWIACAAGGFAIVAAVYVVAAMMIASDRIRQHDEEWQ